MLFLLLLFRHFVRIMFCCFYLPCWLAWWQRLKLTPHLISGAVCPATNLSTNIKQNPTVSNSVCWTDRPNGSQSVCTKTMVPYQDRDRNFLWEVASKPCVYPFFRRSVCSFSLRQSYVVKEDQKQPTSRLHQWRLYLKEATVLLNKKWACLS